MKRIVALVLVFMMIAAAGIACADTLDFIPGSPTTCSIDDFKLFYNYFTSSSGYSFVWEENAVKEDAWDVYSAMTSDGSMNINIYCTDGNVVYVVRDGFFTADLDDSTAADQFGQWFGFIILDPCMSLFLGEKGIEAMNDDVQNRMTTEMITLYTDFENELYEGNLEKGMAFISSILDYPTGVEASSSIIGTMININLRVVSANQDSTLKKQ